MSDPSAEPLFSPFDAWDPLHEPSWPNEHWSTANVGEALPGVLTPLGWTLWGTTIERAMRKTMVAMGALHKPEAALPARVVPPSTPEITAAAKTQESSKAAKKREKTEKTRQRRRDREFADRDRGPYADPRSAYASPYVSRYETPRRSWGW